MRRAGTFTAAKKVDRLYENIRAEYKLFVRLEEDTDLSELTNRTGEYKEIKNGRPTSDKSVLPLRPPPTTAATYAGDANNVDTAGSTTGVPPRNFVLNAGRMAYSLRIATRCRETPPRPEMLL